MDSIGRINEKSDGVELILSGQFGDESFSLKFDDPEILAVLQRVERNRGSVVETMIHVGTYALQASSTGLDVRAVRLELERAADNAKKALSDMQTQVADTIGDGGLLATAMDAARSKLMGAMDEVISRRIDWWSRCVFRRRCASQFTAKPFFDCYFD